MAKLIRISELIQKTGLSSSTIWRLEKQGKFPLRKKVGSSSVAWIESEIDSWINNLSKVKGGAK